jgi:hypothetical protein
MYSMFTGNIQEARDAAQMSRKWLIVNIQNVSEFPCQVLNRDVWSNRTIKELVKENFLFLQVCSHTNPIKPSGDLVYLFTCSPGLHGQ